MKRPKVAFFDLNNTCLQMAGATREEIERYITHIRQSSWQPLTLPSHWRQFPVWTDALPNIWNMRQYLGITCVTLSNNPINVQLAQIKYAMLGFDFLVPLEAYHVFKPDVKAYQVACNLLQVAPEDALMVTANKDFGDIEGAAAIGMPSVWIDRKNEDPTYSIKNFHDLVKELK